MSWSAEVIAVAREYGLTGAQVRRAWACFGSVGFVENLRWYGRSVRATAEKGTPRMQSVGEIITEMKQRGEL